MRKSMLKLGLSLFLSLSLITTNQVEAADRNLINFDEAYNMLFSPDFDGYVMSQAEADAVIEAIIADIDANYMHYSQANRQAFYNAVESHIPGNMMGAVHKTMPEYFVDYVDALNAENGVASGPQSTDDAGNYAVDATAFDTIVDFHQLTPTYRHIQVDTVNQELNFQGRVLDGTANYTYTIQEQPNQKIKVFSSDGSGVREVVVSTNMIVQGLNANYHYGTDQAFLFYNSQGSVSLAYPDLTGLLNDMDEPVWLEYRFHGNYGTGFKMLDHQEIADGRPEFDLSREWWDQLGRMDVEYTVAHVVGPESLSASSYNFNADPVISQWYQALVPTQPDWTTAAKIYDHTFAYELLKGGYSQEESEMVNALRIRAYDFIRRAEDNPRYEQRIRSTKVALADRLFNREKLKADPVLEEIFNQIAVYTGMTLEGRDLLFLEQNGNQLQIGIAVSEAFGSGYPVFVYDLETGAIYNDIMGGDLELISDNIIKTEYGVDVPEYKPAVNVPGDYQLNQNLVDELVRQ